MTYKNLLYREKARLADSEEEKKKLTAMADEWFNKALETRKRNDEKKTSCRRRHQLSVTKRLRPRMRGHGLRLQYSSSGAVY